VAHVAGSWAQFDALKTQGADALLWSIGGMISDGTKSKVLALKYNVVVVASEDNRASALIDQKGASLPSTSARLAVDGYTAEATVVVAEVSSRG